MTASADRPDRPWRPTQFRVSGVYKRTQQVWVTDRRTGERVRRKVARFDIRCRVDGHQFSYTFEQRGWADSEPPSSTSRASGAAVSLPAAATPNATSPAPASCSSPTTRPALSADELRAANRWLRSHAPWPDTTVDREVMY